MNSYQLKQHILQILQFLGYKSLYRKIESSASKDIFLEVGSGNVRRQGWITSDNLLRAETLLDVRNEWKVENKIKYIYSEMMVASLNYLEAEAFFRNARKALVKGGVLRICTTHLLEYARVYLNSESEESVSIISEMQQRNPGNKFIFFPSDIIRYPFVSHSPGFESYAYDFKTLEILLRKAGFTKIICSEVGVSEFANLRGLEKRRSENLDKLQLIVEAIK